MTIYDRIRQLRISLGMSQEELAKKVGYAERAAISKVEKGYRDISCSMIEKYAAALNVSPTYLLFGDGENKDSGSQKQELLTIFHTLGKKDRQKLIAYAYDLKKEASKGMTTVKFAARDGTYKELQLTDEQLQELIKKAEALEDAPDNL